MSHGLNSVGRWSVFEATLFLCFEAKRQTTPAYWGGVCLRKKERKRKKTGETQKTKQKQAHTHTERCTFFGQDSKAPKRQNRQRGASPSRDAFAGGAPSLGSLRHNAGCKPCAWHLGESLNSSTGFRICFFFFFPLLVLKGTYHYWKKKIYIYIYTYIFQQP